MVLRPTRSASIRGPCGRKGLRHASSEITRSIDALIGASGARLRTAVPGTVSVLSAGGAPALPTSAAIDGADAATIVRPVACRKRRRSTFTIGRSELVRRAQLVLARGTGCDPDRRVGGGVINLVGQVVHLGRDAELASHHVGSAKPEERVPRQAELGSGLSQ